VVEMLDGKQRSCPKSLAMLDIDIKNHPKTLDIGDIGIKLIKP
jgi:hypothetical protein